MGNIKRLIVVLLVGMIAIGCVACSGTTSEDSKVNLEDSNGYKTAKEVNSLGMNAVQMVKYVYREAETKEDDSTKANIKQVKESLEQLQ